MTHNTLVQELKMQIGWVVDLQDFDKCGSVLYAICVMISVSGLQAPLDLSSLQTAFVLACFKSICNLLSVTVVKWYFNISWPRLNPIVAFINL